MTPYEKNLDFWRHGAPSQLGARPMNSTLANVLGGLVHGDLVIERIGVYRPLDN